MSQRRIHAVAGVVGGRLVVAGGYSGDFTDGDELASVEAYTPTGWVRLPPMPHAAHFAKACVLNERFYVMGGITETSQDKVQVLEMSDENGFSWTVKADLPAERSVHGGAGGCVPVDGKVWLMGEACGDSDGEDEPEGGPRIVYIYNTNLDSWSAGPPLPPCYCDPDDCTAVLHAGEIHVVSGGAASAYRGGAWESIPGGHCAAYGTCGSVLLG